MKEVFGEDSRAILFGSRIDDSQRGGDIDLFIETNLSTHVARSKKIRFLIALKRNIGDRKIDVVVRGSDSTSKPIYSVAQAEGEEV